MASRLSELSIKSTYNSGFRGLSWSMPKIGANLLRVDLDKILASTDAEDLIQSLPTQILYHSIKHNGLEHSAEVIGLMSDDQFTRSLDYDVWPQSTLSQKELLSWLMPLKTLGPVAMARRFKGLEEEYQLAALDKLIQVFDEEEFEKLPDYQKEQISTVPGGQMHYRILSEDSEIYDAVSELINSATALDVGYALSLLSFASAVPPNEAEFSLQQFRKARLEEDGFVSYEEALSVFDIVDVEAMRARWQLASKQSEVRSLVPASFDDVASFVEAVVFYGLDQNAWSDEDGLRFQQGVLMLANSLASAANVDSSDVEAINLILEQSKALVSLGLEYLSDGDLSRALICLKNEYPKQLFRVGYSLVARYQRNLLAELSGSIGDELSQRLSFLLASKKWGEAQWTVDTQLRDKIGLQAAEALKGLFNRYPMRPSFAEKDGVETIQFAPLGRLAEFKALQRDLGRLLDSNTQTKH